MDISFEMIDMKHLVKDRIMIFMAIIFMLFVTRLAFKRLYIQESSLDQSNYKSAGSSYFEMKMGQIASVIQYFKINNIPLVRLDTTVPCQQWAVVTTIFVPSDSVRKVAQDPNWCLVIVGDKKTSSKQSYMSNLGNYKKENVVFLNTDDQEKIFPLLSKTLPWNHFSRKNIGYMYAIKRGAEVIWDFDDDNINIVPANLAETTKTYRTPCGEFKNHLFNPYPYFAVNETFTWPRGFPLEHIRDGSTHPPLCTSSQPRQIGVIQSLANIEPDVDAIYRFTRQTPFKFGATPSSHLPVMVPDKAFTPFNGQATLWRKASFKYLALPVSVTGRVSDIWRSYIAEYFFHKLSLSVLFTSPYVDQYRNAHDYLVDFTDELDLYQKSNALLKWLSDSSQLNVQYLVDLYREMFTKGYLNDGDVEFITAWIMTFEEN